MSNLPYHKRAIDPIKLATYILIGVAAASVLSVLFNPKLIRGQNLSPYLLACSSVLLYALFNSIGLVNTDDTKRYWIRSMLGFIILLLGGILVSYILTGVSVTDAQSYYQIYAVVTVGYLVFLSIMGFIRFFLEWAQQMDR